MAQDVLSFGKDLIGTEDLDPVYVVVNQANLGEKLKPWLLAYWCFYHMGTASWIVDQPSYWAAMEKAAGSRSYYRGTERRHFRGENANKSVSWLKKQGLETLFAQFDHPEIRSLPLATVMEIVQRWTGFGPWIAFKVADMLERLGLLEVRFVPEDVFHMFEAPRKGAQAVWENYGQVTDEYPDEGAEMWAYDYITGAIGRLKAPPTYDRVINIQEVETILCKWKSHLNGHYEVGKDVREIREGLDLYNKSTTANKLIKAGKEGDLW